MPSKSSGRILKARKNSTPHQKNHRFESFTAKIAKFNSLQPLRKIRRHDLDSEDLSATTSYFRNGLQKWGELNISKDFVSFKREVLPLSESLPQILHFEKRIMELLAHYIAMQEKEALEPLLELLTAFAHDLGMRFEKHYAKSLGLIVGIAGKPQDVEVVEWTFGALAFLFKYLSKLLVPNLRPTFDAVAPLLGKSRHPPYIARFAAEALSFLVKKAGAPSHRETALPAAVKHVKSDLCGVAGDRQFTLYRDGVMTMFAEAMKGNDKSIHSSGSAIFMVLMDAAVEEESGGQGVTQNEIWTDVVSGVLTSVIHHSTPDTFGELLQSMLERIKTNFEQLGTDGKWWSLRPYIRVLGILAGVRKGSRVGDNWAGVVHGLVDILELIGKGNEDSAQCDPEAIWRDIMVQVAITWHHAPIDALIPLLARFSRSLTKGPLMKWFISFSSYVCELDAARFASLLRGEFQK